MIHFPKDAGIEVVLIPKYIPKTKTSDLRQKMENQFPFGRQTILTSNLKLNITSKYSAERLLFTTFLFRDETVGFSKGEYVITHYYVTETDNPCLDFIGLGNQNIAEEKSENVYALISVSGDTCADELSEMTNKKLKTVANKVYSQ